MPTPVKKVKAKKKPTIDELIEKAKADIESTKVEIKELEADQDKIRGLFLKHDLYSDAISDAKQDVGGQRRNRSALLHLLPWLG